MLLAALSAISLAAVAAQAQTIIQVGGNASTPGGILQFTPPSVNATNGTIIIFTFNGIPGNHSVVQSSFALPCNQTAGGFDSGFVGVSSGVTSAPTWNVTITNDRKPIWFYCKQIVPATHCDAGMVGAINAAGSGQFTFTNYQAAARAHVGPSFQGNASLNGVGANATDAPGPVVSGVTLIGPPAVGAAGSAAAGSASGTGYGASGSSTASGSTPSSTSAASQIAASSILVLFAAALGFTIV